MKKISFAALRFAIGNGKFQTILLTCPFLAARPFGAMPSPQPQRKIQRQR
jgi:hypothetical protein